MVLWPSKGNASAAAARHRFHPPVYISETLSFKLQPFMSTLSSETSPQHSHETVSNRLTELVAKDQRAYERARHQTKERREHAQMKERKDRATAGFRALALKEGHLSRAAKRASMEFWDGDEPDSPTLTEFGRPLNVSMPRNKSGFSKMALADFVTSKTKKLSRMRGMVLQDFVHDNADSKLCVDVDFEVLPPVRSVIALDDFGHDIEINEPWEFISLAPESPTWKGLSYAQAAALTL